MARQGLLPNVYRDTGRQSESGDAAVHVVLAAANGPELLVAEAACRARRSPTTIPSRPIREDFGTMRTDYIIGDRDTLSASYTIDDGNSLIPLADPLFASADTLRSQVASLQETHVSRRTC